MTWAALLGLIACNAIWATNPLMGKFLLAHHSPLQVSWLRYGAAFAAAGTALLSLRALRPELLSSPRRVFASRAFHWVAAMGLLTFFGSAVLQLEGLSQSTSTANAILVALEPLFAVLLAWIFLHEALRKRQALAFACALLGFLLLSNLKPYDFFGTIGLFSFGNLLLLLCMPLESMYSIITRKIAGRLTPLSLFSGALTVGFAAITAYLGASGQGFPDLGALTYPEWGALLWMGPLGTTLTYIFWSVALERSSVATVSLTLFIQPILGAGFAAIFLEERMDLWQAGGAGLILGALALQTTVALAPARPEENDL